MEIMNRRSLLRAGFSAAALATALPLFAISTTDAQNFVQGAIKELDALVNTGKSADALQKDLGAFLDRYADVQVIARSVLGSPWREMSPTQRANYVDAFRHYLLKKYTASFSDLRGGASKITKVTDGGRGGVLVDMEYLAAGKPAQILQLQISDQGGAPKILDIRFEGVSVIGTEREQVRAMLAKSGNDINTLIATLNAY